MKRRPRILLRLSFCLVLGVITTIVVAWGFAIMRRPIVYNQTRVPTMGKYHARESDSYWDIALLAEAGTAHLRVRAIPGAPTSGQEKMLREDQVPRWSILRRGVDEPVSLPALPTTTEMARGWPFYALSNRVEEDTQRWTRHVYDAIRVAIGDVAECPLVRLPESFLPLRPILPGFIINTVFFAAIWFASIFGLGSFKRAKQWNRRRRGLCPKCAHDLRGNPEGVTGCPECGWGRDST